MARPIHPGESARAASRARNVLKPGDRIRVRRLDGLTTLVFDAWADDLGGPFISRSGIFAHPVLIEKVNGAAVTFRDPLPDHPAEAG